MLGIVSENSQNISPYVRDGGDAGHTRRKRADGLRPLRGWLVVSAQSDTAKVVWRDAGGRCIFARCASDCWLQLSFSLSLRRHSNPIHHRIPPRTQDRQHNRTTASKLRFETSSPMNIACGPAHSE